MRSSADTNEEASALRRARLHRNWTLEDAVAEIDVRCAGGASGATPSLLSAWERGKVRTSPRYRRLLCEMYRTPPEVLFAHQDRPSHGQPAGFTDVAVLRVLHTHEDLLGGMIEVVRGARSVLAVTGSRSRDAAYLAVVEEVLAARPEVVHYRVLYGPPQHHVLRDHLLRLLELRDPSERPRGVKTLHVGLADPVAFPERFIVAAESAAIVAIPSLTTAEAFDTGVLLGGQAADGLVHHVREAYAGARRVESVTAVRALPVVRGQTAGDDPAG